MSVWSADLMNRRKEDKSIHKVISIWVFFGTPHVRTATDKYGFGNRQAVGSVQMLGTSGMVQMKSRYPKRGTSYTLYLALHTGDVFIRHWS